jgi:hypothetical protein
VRVATEAVVGFKQRHVEPRVEEVGTDESGNPAAYDGDTHLSSSLTI